MAHLSLSLPTISASFISQQHTYCMLPHTHTEQPSFISHTDCQTHAHTHTILNSNIPTGDSDKSSQAHTHTHTPSVLQPLDQCSKYQYAIIAVLNRLRLNLCVYKCAFEKEKKLVAQCAPIRIPPNSTIFNR